MKKINLFVSIALVGILGVFSGCEDDDGTALGPTIDFIGGEYIDEDATVEPGAELKFKWQVTKGDASLDEFKIVSQNEDVFGPVTGGDLDNSLYIDETTLTASEEEGVYDYVFRATDKDGNVTSETIKITVEKATTDLSAEQEAVWERTGSAAATGLSPFGLKWVSNEKAIMAVISKDAATKFVQLSSDAWTTIETQEALKEAVDAAEGITEYKGIPATAGKTDYTDVLATIYNDEYIMIKIVSSTAESVTQGTKITVNIKYKK